nr:olfactory receptor 64 [Microplitis mediator]
MEKTPIDSHCKVLDIGLHLAKIWGLIGLDNEPPGRYIAIVVFQIFNWVMTTILIILNTSDFIVNFDDLGEVSYNLGYIFPMTTGTIKAYTLLKHQKSIRKLLDDIHKPITKLKYSSDLGALTTVRIGLTYQNMDFVIFTIACTTVVLTLVLPLPIILKTRQLPIRVVVPFDKDPDPIFELVYLFELYGLFTECLWTIIFDPITMGFIRWIDVQLIILRANYRHCHDLDTPRATFSMEEQDYRTIKNYKYFNVTPEQRKIRAFVPFSPEEAYVENDSFVKRFKLCVKHHRRLINLIDRYNSTYSVVLFAQISSDCLLTCIGLFQMALGLKRERNVFRDVIMLGSGLIHLAYWCILGNQLIIEVFQRYTSDKSSLN